MSEKGYIYLERKLRDHWLWNDKPFSMGQAWIDLILSANHEDRDIVLNGNKVKIRRGQFVTSITKLAEHWGWDRKKVRRFLNALQMDSSVDIKVTTHGTTVTLVKYGDYQNKRTAKRTTNAHPMGQQMVSNSPQTRNYKELEVIRTKEGAQQSDEDDDGMSMEEYDKMREAEKHGTI